MIKNPIIAVVVVYKPKIKELEITITSLLENFSKLIVVWNDSGLQERPNCIDNSRINFIYMKKNVGLAAALNKGIQKAFNLGAKWVYLSDQDSVLSSDFKNLAIKHSQLIPKNYKVATIGPSYFNEVTKKDGRIVQSRFLRSKHDKSSGNKFYIETDSLITSGSFISKISLDHSGLMDERFFIDLIDIEWGLRARSKGYSIFMLTQLKLSHRLGVFGQNFFWTIFPIHPPLRIYYYFRNSIYLYKQDYISFSWKFNHGLKNIFRFLFYIVLVKPRLEYLKMSTLGIYHGIINRMGEYKR
jgi:rhamnosyltransferase